MKKKIEIFLTEKEEYALYQLAEKLDVNINDLISETIMTKIQNSEQKKENFLKIRICQAKSVLDLFFLWILFCSERFLDLG